MDISVTELHKRLPIMAEFHMALSDVNRLRMVRILATEKDVTVSDLAKRLGITQPAVSQHLRVLKMIGLLQPARQGNRTIYKIDLASLEAYHRMEDEMYEVIKDACQGCEWPASE